MLGGAVAMGLAAFISARSQVEFYESEIEREREEIERWPERERDEISTIYRNKGFAGPLLEQIVAHITSDPERWSNVMMREELGFNEESFDRPLRSAFAVGLSYLFGAFVPVWPYIFFEPTEGVLISAISTIVVLFAVGALKTIITSRSWWRSGFESMLTGIAAASVTYAAGRLFAAR
jgi:VIT1/CCC1 family predicted Fe2+/Mn2+ transporter